MIHELLYFLYFDYEFLPKTNNKQSIIKRLYKLNDTKTRLNFNCYKSKFYILDDLLNLLIKDPYVRSEDKIFANKLLFDSKKRQKKINKILI